MTEFLRTEQRIYVVVSIVAYIALASCAFVAQDEQDDKHNNKNKKLYIFAGSLACAVVLYHALRLGGVIGEGRFSDVMGHGLVPMIVGSIAVLTTLGIM